MSEKNAPSGILWSKSFVFAWIANFMMGFAFYLLIPTLPFYLVDTFGSDSSTVGFVIAAYVIAALIIRPFSGYIVDRFPRKLVYIVSFCLFLLFYAGYFVAASVMLVLLLRVLHGFTWGVITTSGNTVALDITPAHKRGQAVGYYGLALNIAMALSPVAGISIYEHWGANALFTTAIVTSAIGLFSAILIHIPEKHHKKHSVLSLDRFLLLEAIPVGGNLLIATISYGMILSFAAMYGKEMGASSGAFYVLLAVGIGASRIFSGKLIDSGKITEVTTVGLVLLAASFILFSLVNIPTAYYIAALAIGLGYGICYPAFQTMIVSMAPHEMRGTANSTYFTAFDTGVGLGMYLAGWIASKYSLSMSFGFSAAMHVLAVLYFLKVTSVQRKS